MKKIIKTYAIASLFVALLPNFLSAQTLDEAIKHLDAERFVAATQAFNKLAETSATPQTLFYKGYAILKSPDGITPESLKNAQEAFEKGNALDKKGDPLNQIGLGMLKLASKDFAGAKLIFEEVKKATKSKNTDVLYRIAEAYTMFPNANDPAEAILNIDLALEKSKVKDNPEYYFVKSDAYMLKNEGGDAMNALQNAGRMNKKQGKTYEKMSRVWLQGKNYTEAKDAIDKGIAADPTHAPIHRYASSYYQTRNNYKESAAAARKYLDNSDGDCKAKLRYAKLAFIAKDFENVKKTIEEIKVCNTDPYVNRMMGIINFEEKNPLEAIDALKKFIEKVPADESPAMDYGYIGRSYMIIPGEGETKSLNDSLGILNIEKAISLGDTSFNFYDDLAATFMKNKNYSKAATFAEKSLLAKKNPNGADYAKVGSYFSYARDWAKSDPYLDKALELYKDAWIDGFELSASVKSYKNTDSTYRANYTSAPLYEKYLSLLGETGKADPKNKIKVRRSLLYLVGREYLLNKNIPKATELLTELLKYDPENQDALKQLEVIKATGTATPPSPGK